MFMVTVLYRKNSTIVRKSLVPHQYGQKFCTKDVAECMKLWDSAELATEERLRPNFPLSREMPGEHGFCSPGYVWLWRGVDQEILKVILFINKDFDGVVAWIEEHPLELKRKLQPLQVDQDMERARSCPPPSR